MNRPRLWLAGSKTAWIMTPRSIRVYDNGRYFDRYTVVYTGRYRYKTGGSFMHVGMSHNPFHPQGVGQHGFSNRQIDVNTWGFAPAIGRKCHLGRRIEFGDLPKECQQLVRWDYLDLWN